MPITQYNSSVRQMSQSKFDSMKNASGKIPDLANQIVMTNSEDSNVSCLRTEVVYDMTSSDASKNWGYTSGIQGGVTVSGKDFSKYDKLMFYGYRTGIMTFCAEIDITIPTKSPNIFGRATNCFHFIESNVSFIAGMTIELNTSLTGFTAKFNQDANDRNSNAEWFVAKIEGVLKTPSMIYTGDELIAGNGISINSGVISSKCSTNILWSGSKNNTGDISLTDDLNNYTLLIFTGYNSSNEYYSQCVVRSTITTATSSSLTYDIGNNTYTANRYCNVYYKNQRTLTIHSIGNMTLKWVEGVR